MRYLVSLICGALSVTPLFGGQNEILAAALADAKRLPLAEVQVTRYLHSPLREKSQARKVYSFWANSLSTAPDLVPMRRVNAELLAIRLIDYNWDKFT